jgi:nitroreductase
LEEQDWVQVVAAAVRAPSIHNTQPWTFLAGSDRLGVRLDRERALPVVDPTGRQQVISCGIAVEFAAVALQATGAAAEVELLPDPADEDLLATVRMTGTREVTAEDRALLDAIARRHTVRSAFASRAVPAALLEGVQTEAESRGVWVEQITREEEEVATVFLLARAEELEQGSPDYLAELQRWLRSDPGAEDGVPVEAVLSEDPATRPSNWLIRDFVAGQREPHPPFLPAADPDAPPPAVERPTVLLLGTENDDRRAWLQAGQALGRLLLQATTEGVAASPLTQALDWPATRTQLRRRLSLVGYPQMLLRMGYPTTEDVGVVSGRRPVDEVLRFAPSDA